MHNLCCPRSELLRSSHLTVSSYMVHSHIPLLLLKPVFLTYLRLLLFPWFLLNHMLPVSKPSLPLKLLQLISFSSLLLLRIMSTTTKNGESMTFSIELL